jgi:phage gpG-like protein
VPVLQGDFGALEDLQARIRAVTQPGFKEAVARRLTGTAIKLLADEFRKSQNPYGAPWKPPKHRKGKPLLDTGRLRAASVGQTASSASGAVVRVVIPVEYASFLQDGTRFMERRQIVPDRAGGLGPIWTAAFRKEIELSFKQRLAPGSGGKGGAS